MIKVFLVEDEKIIRKSIKNNVKWEENGFEFAGEAPDGEMALPMIEKLHPDIVITDIKMPFIDGLELSDILKKKMPKIQIIILSGYGEFDYAKEAIKIGVTDYLTKPVTGEQLLEALNKVKQKLDKKKRQEEDIKKLQKNIKTQMKNMRYQFFGNLIRGKISVSKLMEQGNELGIDLMAPAYNFMLFKIFSKNENDTEAVYDLRTKEDAIVEEVSSQFENMIVFHRVTEGYVLMIKAQNKEETIQVAKDYVAALTKRMKKEKELQWFAGIGRAVERLHNLSESYDSASKAFAYQYQSSGNEAVFFDKLDNEKIERAEDLQQVDFTKVNSESLEEFLKNGKEEAVHLFVEDYTKTLGKSNMDSFMFCQYMLINIQVGVMKFVEKMGVEKANIDRTFKDYKQQIAAVSTGEKAAEYIESVGNWQGTASELLAAAGIENAKPNQFTYNMAKYFDKVFEPKNIRYKTHRKNKVRLLNFYGDDGDGGDDDIDITQLSGWGIPERPSPSSPSSLGALEGSKHGQSVATGQPAEKPTGTAPNPCEAAGA